MTDLVSRLPLERDQRGSKVRCHLLTHGSRTEVAARLDALGAPFVSVTADDCWMPEGFNDLEEAQLHNAPRLLDLRVGNELRKWWLAPASSKAKTPHMDIASTCTIDGRRGFLFVEAKAYEGELTKAEAGKQLKFDASQASHEAHRQIGGAILEASLGLSRHTNHIWALARDHRYQMSNRFAWAWKLSQLGFPVVLIYLGFLDATEMGPKRTLLRSHDQWEKLVVAHGDHIVSPGVWESSLSIDGVSLTPLIRTVRQPLCG